ncbi:MAG: threonylcarbamoyl-AMP synthase [Treponema sp.]|jgi:L-threonylcarbamoyladenylate synthase|nr:threonylcarbamoyl-AMP synthase [Treponema sp.]
MPLLKVSDESIRQAAALLAQGGLAAFPTETVYGLGGDAFNPLALARIFEVKGRPRFDPLIVHIAAYETLEKIADISLLDTRARQNLAALTGQFWPGPLTLILPKQKAVPDLATSGLPTVAVRLPAHDAARRLIELSTGAVAAPSANPFGYLSPTRAEHVFEMLGEKVDIILDGGPCQFGLESTVLDISGGQPRILRPGAVAKESIEALIGPVASGNAAGSAAGPAAVTENDAAIGAVSPGLLKSHYAPHIPLLAQDYESPRHETEIENAAFLFFDGASRDKWLSGKPKPQTVTVLSETGNMLEAAARLFETLHELDRLDVRRIYAQLAPEEGLGAAINDRLRRASNI